MRPPIRPDSRHRLQSGLNFGSPTRKSLLCRRTVCVWESGETEKHGRLITELVFRSGGLKRESL